MSTDFTKIQMLSSASSLKILQEGTGSFSVASLPGAGETYSVATVAHNYGSDNLLFQVATSGGTSSGTVLPWEPNDSRMIQYARIDSSNLYIFCISSDSSGSGAAAYTITYYYRILVP